MLTCDAKEMIFSSYAGNIYEIQGSAVKKGYFRNCRVLHMPDGQAYRLYILDYYLTSEAQRKYRKWMETNFEKCFGGHIAEEVFLWPVDYVWEHGDKENAGSLGLLFHQKQFDGLTEAEQFLMGDSAPSMLSRLFKKMEELHEEGVCLNGIEPGQLFFSGKGKLKIQALHNCMVWKEDAQSIREWITDGARYLYQEKAFSLPLGSGWKNLTLGTYACCNDIYSLASILFYALMGRHPLNGRLCDDQEDKEGRKVIYNQNPCFIFDPEDKRNEIGQFEQEKRTIARWECLPSGLKKLFCQLYSFPAMGELEAERMAKQLECFRPARWVVEIETLVSSKKTEVPVRRKECG